MSDNNYDEKQTHKPKTPQTPFGGWGNQAASGDDASGGPRPVVSNEDGSQRPADSNELSMPKRNAEEGIKSFSATFGTVKEETPEEKADKLFSTPIDTPAPEEDFTFAAPAASAEENTEPSEYKYTFSALDESGAPLEETTALTSPTPVADEPSFSPPAPLAADDPFAWTPEEAPSANEPRRQSIGGETWMATDTSYEDLQNASNTEETAEQDDSGEVMEEDREPAVNPFMFGKEEGFKAPPMDASLMDDSANKKNFEFSDTAKAEQATSEQPPAQEDAPASPFEFAAFTEDAPAEEVAPAAPQPQQEDSIPQEDALQHSAPAPEAEHLGTAEAEHGNMMMGESEAEEVPAPHTPPTPLLMEEPAQTDAAAQPDETIAEQPQSEKKTSFQPYRPAAPAEDPAPESVGQETMQNDFMTASPAPVADAQPMPLPATEEIPENTVPADENPFTMPAPEAPAQSTEHIDDTQEQPTENPFALQTPPPAPPMPEEQEEEQNPFAAPEAQADFQPEDAPADIYAGAEQASADMPPEETAFSSPEAAENNQEWGSPAETEQPLPAPPADEMPAEEQPAFDAADSFTEPSADAFAADTFATEQPEAPQEAQTDAWASAEDNNAFTDTAESAWQPAAENTTDHSAGGLPPEDVQSILQGHILWLNSDGKDGRRANFRNANLQGLDLSNNQLAEASFRGANLQGASLNGCDMRGADLSEAQLSGASLASSNLGGTIFSRADLRHAQFNGSDLQAADFSNAQLSGTDLQQLNLASAIFLEADMQGANLTQSSLIGANLRGANLTSANLTAANLSGANCRDVQFAQATLDYAVFEGANLKNTNLQNASLLGADLSSAGDSSPEQRQDTLLAEKEQLAQEWQRVKEYESQVQGLQASLQQREMTLQTERMNAERARREVRAQHENMEQLMQKTHEVMQRHRVHDRLFKYFGVTWFLFTILAAVSVMMFVNALQLGSLSWLELSIVFGGCTLIMGLFIATTVRSIKLSNNLKQLLDSYAQFIPHSHNE